MAPSAGFKDFIKDQLAAFGPVTIRNMFGGAGVYADGVMFGLLANDVLYLKADAATAGAFEAEGMRPFTYQPEGKPPVAMSYWEVPPRLLEEPDELAVWAREAHRIACAGKATRRPRKRR
jgi:DNA transformation protein and related proteins